MIMRNKCVGGANIMQLSGKIRILREKFLLNRNFENTIMALRAKKCRKCIDEKQNSHYYIKYKNGTKSKKVPKIF